MIVCAESQEIDSFYMRFFNKGKSLFNSGDYREAVKELEAAEESKPFLTPDKINILNLEERHQRVLTEILTKEAQAISEILVGSPNR